MKKIVIAADSFKGSITSAQFADACAEVISELIPQCEIVKLCMGDGGEGTTQALASAVGGERVAVNVHDPLMRVVEARYCVSAGGETAIMEMAQASGLPLLAEGERNPMLTTTFGAGEMMAHALGRGCREIIIGIGGSATNDGGMGLLKALGARFYGGDGCELQGPGCGAELEKVQRVDLTGLNPLLAEAKIRVACDVDNPFCGPNGAAHIFARQKGASDEMIEKLDSGMHRFAEVLKAATGMDIAHAPGAGAAGGLGGALKAALGASLEKGVELVLDVVQFESHALGADLVITGEGRIDAQTAMGKTAQGVLGASQKAGVPVVALGGAVDYSPELNSAGFAAIFPIQPGPIALSEAMNPTVALRNLKNTVRQVVGLIVNTQI